MSQPEDAEGHLHQASQYPGGCRLCHAGRVFRDHHRHGHRDKYGGTGDQPPVPPSIAVQMQTAMAP